MCRNNKTTKRSLGAGFMISFLNFYGTLCHSDLVKIYDSIIVDYSMIFFIINIASNLASNIGGIVLRNITDFKMLFVLFLVIIINIVANVARYIKPS